MVKNFFLILLSFIFPIILSKNESFIFIGDEDLEEIIINGDNELEYEIKENKSYVFTIANEKYFYCFSALIENIFFVKINDTYEEKPNETFFETGEQIYVNLQKNINNTKIKVSPANIYIN